MKTTTTLQKNNWLAGCLHVLLNSLKREAYNDELRNEELLNWFRRPKFTRSTHPYDELASKYFVEYIAGGKPLVLHSCQARLTDTN
ncbi:hypothetical protein C5167_006060 [Papaver somniferum]|uniref:Uncharacterized protein n=1 Tax=Papaver somniferum TaxID=3469 RepID=A0A4Y7JG38_PAPSO|nr:hypothetical protein C5167_006060 [Papaver somniferum]